MSTEARVSRHYGGSGLADRILRALAESGQPAGHLTPEALFPFDQLHARQLAATRDHVGRLGLDASKLVLDVGSGIGGPARYMAATFGCRVVGIDLTDDFVAAARELTARCGLSSLVEFRVADALAMPVGDRHFDAVTCQYVAMNIADKAGLLAEIFRVLKPGGKLVWSSVMAGTGEPRYPLPWARDPSVSFLISPEELRSLFEASDLAIREWTEETDLLRSMPPITPDPAVRAMSQIVLGADFAERIQNFGRNLGEGRLRSVLVVAERP